MLINNRICGLLGLARRAGKVSFGTEMCIQDIEKNRIKLIIIAKDASTKTKTNFEGMCKAKNIPMFEILTIDELSKAIGQSNKAIIGVKDKNF